LITLLFPKKGFYSFEDSGLLAKIESTTNLDLTFKKQEAYEKSLRDQKIKTPKAFLKNGVGVEIIIKSIGLTLAEVEKLLPKKKK
jgi:hypothetical protein